MRADRDVGLNHGATATSRARSNLERAIHDVCTYVYQGDLFTSIDHCSAEKTPA